MPNGWFFGVVVKLTSVPAGREEALMCGIVLPVIGHRLFLHSVAALRGPYGVANVIFEKKSSQIEIIS